MTSHTMAMHADAYAKLLYLALRGGPLGRAVRQALHEGSSREGFTITITGEERRIQSDAELIRTAIRTPRKCAGKV